SAVWIRGARRMTDRESLRRTFDQQAELYQKARPDYPEALFDELFALAELPPGASPRNRMRHRTGDAPACPPRMPRRLCRAGRTTCSGRAPRAKEISRRGGDYGSV